MPCHFPVQFWKRVGKRVRGEKGKAGSDEEDAFFIPFLLPPVCGWGLWGKEEEEGPEESP